MEKGVTASNKKRNPNLDLIRCIAVFCVIAVHFFKNTGYYKLPLVGGQMFFIEYMRTTFMVCVPLFLLLTGYLMNKKELNLKYYKGILHTLGIYFVTSIFCIVYQCYVLGDLLSLKYIITGILSFTANPYSWYIQMYIGLFLLIPFLNTIYNGLKSKKEKQILILTFFTLVTLSTLLGTVKINCISSWWSGIYPLMYYFIGCYLREFPPE